MVKRVRLKKKGRGGSDGVGYCNPPEHTRFKPGQSGNPKGRRKGRKNFKTEFLEMLNSLVKINQNGRVKKITTLRAGIELLIANALRGDRRAMEQFLRLAEKYDHSAEPQVTDSQSSEDDAILEAYSRRLAEHNQQSAGSS